MQNYLSMRKASLLALPLSVPYYILSMACQNLDHLGIKYNENTLIMVHWVLNGKEMCFHFAGCSQDLVPVLVLWRLLFLKSLPILFYWDMGFESFRVRICSVTNKMLILKGG